MQINTIVPPDVPISFKAATSDNCEVSSVEITGYEFFKYTKKGKRIDKTEDGMFELAGDTFTILDSGGVGTYITWKVIDTDTSGHTSEDTCEVLVVGPGKKK